MTGNTELRLPPTMVEQEERTLTPSSTSRAKYFLTAVACIAGYKQGIEETYDKDRQENVGSYYAQHLDSSCVQEKWGDSEGQGSHVKFNKDMACGSCQLYFAPLGLRRRHRKITRTILSDSPHS